MISHRVSLIVQLVKNPPAIQETPVQLLGWEDHWRKDRLPTPVFLDFPCGSAGKESACSAGYLALIPRLGRPPGFSKFSLNIWNFSVHVLLKTGLENFEHCFASM